MSLHKPTIVLFDMDGTTVRHLNPRLLRIVEALDDLSFRATQIVERVFGHTPESPAQAIPSPQQRPRLLVHRVLHRFRRKPVERIVEPCPGIFSLLDFLRRKGVLLGLVSNGLGKGYGLDILEKFSLSPFFEATLFREDILRPKPNPDPLLAILERLSRPVEPEDVVWHIGDRRKDILAAVAAQSHLPCRVQPIAYGLNAAVGALTAKLGPDQIALSHWDIEKRARALWSPS
jgi:phosphoglycolate phosphatase